MTCDKCGHVFQVGDYPFCKGGHARGANTVHGDEIDYIDHNLGEQPIRIRSKAERKRLMELRGLEAADYYVEPPAAFEGKASTQNWAAYRDMSPDNLAWIAEAMTRGGHKREERTMQVDTFIRELR